MPLTGDYSSYGEEGKKGLELAVTKINERNDFKINLVIRDNKSKKSESVKVVKELAQDPEIVLLVGPVVTSNTLAAAPEAQRLKIPMITPSASNYKITRRRGYISRICYTDPLQGASMALFAKRNLKARTAIILDQERLEYSHSLAYAFDKGFKYVKGKVIKKCFFKGKQKDFSNIIKEIKGLKPDVVFISAYHQEAGAIICQARKAGIDCVFLGGDGWDNPLFYEKIENVKGEQFFCTHFYPFEERDSVKKFLENYIVEYKSIPGAMAALCYDTGLAIEYVLKKISKLSRRELRKKINSIKNLEGVTGKITMGRHRNPIKDAVIIQVKKGESHFVTRINFSKMIGK